MNSGQLSGWSRAVDVGDRINLPLRTFCTDGVDLDDASQAFQAHPTALCERCARSPCAGAVSAANWSIDPASTHITFAIDAVGYARTEGQFRWFEGRISVDLGHPQKSSVAFHLQSQSVDVGSPWFSDYVRSAAFLDAAQYPSIDFVSNSVKKIDDHTVRVAGDLTLLGVTKPLSIDVSVRREAIGARPRFAFKAQTQFNRFEFGMSAGFPMVSRDVQLVISSEAAEP